ncbi:MAG: FMN-binding glutamate synthase family protein [Mesonia hippocampi]|uniref:FMN-binding glutamate synthase family protein n=1 Tax=Mesonia hippocampi TaxID=1628250 RepID=UPI003F9C28F0
MDKIVDFLSDITWWQWILFVILLIIVRDVFFNKKHIITHNFPFVGHFRYILESIGPELRQYIVANNREELPFNRVERGWVYASAKNQNNYEGFGTDQNIYETNYIFIKNAISPYRMKADNPNISDPYFLPCAKVMGLHHKRRKPFRPASVINISAMSFGSLSARAVESLNSGAAKCYAYHNTGEGGLSPYHKQGGDIVYQIGTGYFGVRDEEGNFSIDALVKLVEENPCIKAIEIKLSQGAKPGKGGVLPASKITPEISKIRRVPLGKDVISPPYHRAFSTNQEMIDFVEKIANVTGLPVGIKAAIGKLDDWRIIARLMKEQGKGPDFISIDGGEGGTGAAPPSFADHVAMPWMYGFRNIYKIFKSENLSDQIVFVGSGKLGFPSKAAMAFAMGADVLNVAREAMMSIGCIQAQSCHNNTCPTGIATQNKWLQSGINVTNKAERLSYYFKNFCKEFIEITHACGYEHPCQFTMDDVDMNLSDQDFTKSLADSFEYHKTKVPFESMKALMECPFLGGNYRELNGQTTIDKQKIRY